MSRNVTFDISSGEHKKRSKLAARFNLTNISFVILILVLTAVASGTLIYRMVDNAAMEYARTYTMESVDIMGSHLNKEISLIRHASQSPEVIEWFADEENADKKEAAFQKMMLYADILQIDGLSFAITDSLHEYSVYSGASLQEFVPFRELEPSNRDDDWFFNAIGSVFDFTMDLSVRTGTDSNRLWINHRVVKDGYTIGVFSSALDFDEIFQDLFGLYKGQSVRGLVIDYRGIIQLDSSAPQSGYIVSEGPDTHILSVDTDTHFLSIINNNYLRNPAIFYGRRTEPEVIRLSGSGYSYLSIAPIPFTNWLAVTFYDTSALFDITTILPPISAVVLAFIIYVIFSFFLIKRLVFKPLGRFTESIAMTGDDESHIYGIDRDDEIGEIARTARDTYGRLRNMTEELKAAVEEAEAANISKSAFLAKMSHEIRTPMNVILGITEILLQEDKFDAKTNEELATIYNSCDMLLSIINDILDLSKIEAGKLEVYPDKYELASLIHDAAVLNVMRTGSKPIDFKLDIDENLPTSLVGDELRIKQILSNLLSNAFKYTDSGKIDLSFSVEDNESDDNEVMLVFSVADTGHGMTEDELSKMFDEYSRFNLDTNRTIEGTGLGMNITRNLLRLMNGTITVKSEVDKGSIFTVSIPQGNTDSAVMGSELVEKLQEFKLNGIRQIGKANISYEPMPYGRVLIVDDVESNLFVARGLMAPYELSIETVTSGFLAIEKIKEGNVYDVVFMDHMMPKMDGIEATEVIRDFGYTQPIIALTANAVIGQADIFLSNGFDDFISKPIDIRRLNMLLNKYVRDVQPKEVIEAARQKMKGKFTNILSSTAESRISPQLIEFFMLDANRAIQILEDMMNKRESLNESDYSLYTTTVHAMKSALANIGEMDLSSAAKDLEQAGNSNATDTITDQTPLFINSLREVIAKHALYESYDDGKTRDMDYAYLHDKLSIIRDACDAYDNKTAKETIAELRKKAWPPQIKKLLSTMAEQLLSGDSDGVVTTADRINEIASR